MVKKCACVRACVCALIAAFAVPALAGTAFEVTVKTPLGDVRGLSDGEVAVFRGIPYARPPIGELAYAPTQPAERWDGVLDATKFGPIAMQMPGAPGVGDLPVSDADCLTLNIWVPAGAKPGDALPVYVFIHGGAYALGSGSSATYDSTSFARDGIVAVTFNYRLNAQGFLATRATWEKYGTTGNWGHLDQIEALKWVRDNITSFGGDPQKVTVGGESAGSFSVSALLLSPLARGLFRAAIMESGSIFSAEKIWYNTAGDLDRCVEVGQEILHLFDTPDSAVGLARLRGIDPMLLTSVTACNLDMTGYQRYFLMPAFDGYVLPRDPRQALREGQFNRVNLLWGFNTHEGSMFVPEDQTELTYRRSVIHSAGYDAGLKILERFPVDETNSATVRLRQFIGYSFLATPGLKLFADRMSEAGMKVWGYNFDYISPENAQARLGASHAEEMPYIFRTHSGTINEDQKRLTDEMHNRFVNFIKTGDPNGELRTPSGTEWPVYKPNGALLRFDREVRVTGFPGLEDMKFMQDVLYGKD